MTCWALRHPHLGSSSMRAVAARCNSSQLPSPAQRAQVGHNLARLGRHRVPDGRQLAPHNLIKRAEQALQACERARMECFALAQSDNRPQCLRPPAPSNGGSLPAKLACSTVRSLASSRLYLRSSFTHASMSSLMDS